MSVAYPGGYFGFPPPIVRKMFVTPLIKGSFEKRGMGEGGILVNNKCVFIFII